jgi:hypothetical protein
MTASRFPSQGTFCVHPVGPASASRRSAVAREAGDTMDAGGVDGLGQDHRRQDGGQASGQPRFARSRGTQEEVMGGIRASLSMVFQTSDEWQPTGVGIAMNAIGLGTCDGPLDRGHGARHPMITRHREERFCWLRLPAWAAVRPALRMPETKIPSLNTNAWALRRACARGPLSAAACFGHVNRLFSRAGVVPCGRCLTRLCAGIQRRTRGKVGRSRSSRCSPSRPRMPCEASPGA